MPIILVHFEKSIFVMNLKKKRKIRILEHWSSTGTVKYGRPSDVLPTPQNLVHCSTSVSNDASCQQLRANRQKVCENWIYCDNHVRQSDWWWWLADQPGNHCPIISRTRCAFLMLSSRRWRRFYLQRTVRCIQYAYTHQRPCIKHYTNVIYRYLNLCCFL